MAEPDDQPSYIDYETFLAPEFDVAGFANSLVLSTNDPNDAPLDLATPLSRVLFDIQEIDSHIDLLTARSAVPLLTHTKNQTQTSTRIVSELEPQLASLNETYRQLETKVIQKHAEADEVRQVASRLWESLRLGRSVGRCLQLGRQLEIQNAELGDRDREDHRALVRCAHTILSLREVLQQRAPGDEGHGLDRVDAIRSLQDTVITPIEKTVRETAERVVREFSLGATTTQHDMTFAQSEEAKARTVSALVALYLVSPTPLGGGAGTPWTPATMLQALELYLRAALQSSLAALARSLAALPTLERSLAEVSARCQNIVALEQLLASTKAPAHPLKHLLNTTTSQPSDTLLQPLLAKLETGSLPAYFWRTLAGHLSPRVQDIITRGGVSARTLRSNRQGVGESIRACVVKGMQTSGGPRAATAKENGTTNGTGKTATKSGTPGGSTSGNWEREIAVMVGSVVNHLR
ncbi:golgi family transport complex component [Sporothrix brasiliensis 5110]|uniref:Conserved oligomeric Golgi complex subunit 5 n=1 Tax=Sporothrix brasiliensis 5110 TaxID=1398154 RepID=A0A0C2F357_9PEZI|nr:golgi family transport complex component [Sporothrix brasiliensis 5110]KIH93314.1 golgi family transport complex component [Sporothrix brasiliensis 5110]